MDKNYQIIPFKNLKNRMVKTDETSSFKFSFFKEVYDQAAALTNIIAKANEDKSLYDEYVIPRQQTKSVQNVIAFTGRRGTGKTSSMLSFADALSEGRYMDKKIDGINNPYDALQGKQFHALQYIDSSIVSKDEDFFELLLYRMHQYLEDHVKAYNKNSYFKHDAYLSELRENIFKLYNHYTSIRHKEQSESVSSYSLLKKNIEKYNIRNEVIKLVENYIQFLSLLKNEGCCNEKNKDFLIICIDDIDMANSTRLEILQCIYQYFMIPQVVVMITLNVPVITATVKKEFYSNMEISVNSERDRILNISQEQTMDFLRKIIPSDMRITMPSWRKYDYRTLKPTMISFESIGGDKEANNLFPNLKNCFWYKKDHRNMNPKELIMLLLADRAKIFLDTSGLKIHFMEPDSLRNLYDLFYLLYHMKNIKEVDKNNENEEIKKQYYKDLEYNRTILLNYLYFKMIPEFNFDHTLELEFKEFQAEPMDRRGRRIWDYYYKTFFEQQNEERIEMLYGKDFLNNEMDNYHIANYCFGELFRCLYFASRLDLFNKNFVKAVLASFAFTLPQYIETEKDSFKEKEKNKEGVEKEKIRKGMYSRLRDVFGYSFLGTWRRELYSGVDLAKPKIIEDKKINECNDDIKNEINNIIIKDGNVENIIAITVNDEKDKNEDKNQDKNNEKNRENRISITIDTEIFNKAYKDECITHLLYLFLLSTKSVKDNFKVIPMSDSDDNTIFYIDADLDPTAFIVGTIRANRLNYLHFSYKGMKDLTLGRLLSQIGINGYDDNNIIKDKITEIVDDKKELIWFLVKHPDITYNIVKRTISFFLYYSDANLQIRPVEYRYPYQIFKKFYELFIDKFKEELKVYKDAQFIRNMYNLEKEDFVIDDFKVSNISPILEWFLESADYGILSVHAKEHNKKCTEKCADKCINDLPDKLFYQFGCGMDWTGLENHLNNAGKAYYSKYYLNLKEALEAELDGSDYKLFKACKSCQDKYTEIIENNLQNDILQCDDIELNNIFKGIYRGKINKIFEVLTKDHKEVETSKGDKNDATAEG